MTSLHSSPNFVLTSDDGVVTVRIDRAAKKNALTLAMWTELRNLFTQMAGQPEVRAVVLGGTGGSYSAGADIAEFPTVRATAEMARDYEEQVDGCIAAITSLPKPTIAAISGACVGGGFALAQACDFRHADDTAHFAIPAARMGLVYGVTKCRRLASLIGMSNAKAVLLTGKRFECAEMVAYGFVDRRTDGDPFSSALSAARELGQVAPLSVQGMKAILDAIGSGDVDRRAEEFEQLVRAADESADHREAVAAFAEKRPPRFTGH